RHQFGAVSAARAHIQHLHARASGSECQKLDGVATLVRLQVSIGPVGRSDYCGAIELAILRGRGCHRYASCKYGRKSCNEVKRPSTCSLSGHSVLPLQQVVEASHANYLIPILRLSDLRCLIAARDGHDFPQLIDKRIPGAAAVIDDVVEGFENSVRLQFCRMNCQIFSWPLRSGTWQKPQERDVAWNLEGVGAMPAGLIEEENSVSARSDFGCDFME